MAMRKTTAAFLSFMLVVGMIPSAALAEAVAEATEAPATIEYRINAQVDDADWLVFEDDASDDDAEDSDEPQQSTAVTKLELRLRNADGKVQVRTRTANEEWPEAWPSDEPSDQDEQDAAQEKTFSDIQIRLADELAKTHDVWYRVHADGEWLAWVSNGASAGEQNEVEVDDIDVLLLTKEDSAEFVASHQGGSEADDDADDRVGSDADPESKDLVADKDEESNGDASGDEELAGANDITEQNDIESDQTLSQKPSAIVQDEDDEDVALQAQAISTPPVVTYKVHAQTYGWMSSVTSGAKAGTEGEAKRLEAITISLPKGTDGGISYKVHAQNYGWMNEVSNGAKAGTEGEAKRLEAIQIWLTGNIKNSFDVWYRVHAQTYGWGKWVKNGASAGTTGEAKRLEAIQIMLVAKGADQPSDASGGTSSNPSAQTSVTYRANVEGFGWMGWVSDGEMAGSTGISAKLQGFSASLVGLNNSDLHYTAHVQTYGWQTEVAGGETVGRPDQGKRLEAIKMRLTGNAAQKYDIYYRCHIQTYGWLGWACNNANAGSEGFGKRVEAIQVALVPKGGAAPTSNSARGAFVCAPTLRYRGHVQTYGWLSWVSGGEFAGTTGEGKRVEALQAEVSDCGLTGEVRMNAHVQTYGWRGWVGKGGIAGTTGEGKRVEAIRVNLTGELASMYDVWYRVHAQNIGWMGWTKNGASAGTEALALRLEAVQMRLVPKGGSAPGSTASPYVNGNNVSKLGYQNPAGYYQVSSKNVTITGAAQWPWNYVTPSRIGIWASRDDCIEAFVDRAEEYIGTPYVWDYSCAPGVGVDCIGLVYQCAYACGMDLGGGTGYDDFNPWAHYISGSSGWHSHDANNFWDYGNAIHVPLGSRRRGDVISWSGHVAVYLGNDQIVEAYTGMGVIYNSLWAHGTPRGCIRLFQ